MADTHHVQRITAALAALVAALVLAPASIARAAQTTPERPTSAATEHAPTGKSRTRPKSTAKGNGQAKTKPKGDRQATPKSKSKAKTKTKAKGKAKTKKTKAKTKGIQTPKTTATLGTFGVSSDSALAQWKSAGGTAVILPIFWQGAQPTASGSVSLATAGLDGQDVISEIQAAHTDGLAVYLEFDLQYPPSWVLSGVPQFVDQYGTAWSSTTAGADVRDWIWSATGRSDVASFVSGALADLAPVLSDVAGIRAGGGVYGELDFPPATAAPTLLGSVAPSALGSANSFWGYDLAAQSGIGIAAGESPTPLRGYVYGTGTAAENTEWANWYLGSLASWITWYAQLLRSDGWSGPIYVLHPSFGLRPDMATTSPAYEQQLAYGTDPAVMMDAYDTIANVWPWSTWADDTEPYYHPGDTTPSDMAAWRWLLMLAQQRGLAAHIMGENTGGGGAPAIAQLMSGALAAGYTGVFYLDYPSLLAEGLESYLVQQFAAYAPKAPPNAS